MLRSVEPITKGFTLPSSLGFIGMSDGVGRHLIKDREVGPIENRKASTYEFV
jgi:hypothetical protein